jgi:hypothetical protein
MHEPRSLQQRADPSAQSQVPNTPVARQTRLPVVPLSQSQSNCLPAVVQVSFDSTQLQSVYSPLNKQTRELFSPFLHVQRSAFPGTVHLTAASFPASDLSFSLSSLQLVSERPMARPTTVSVIFVRYGIVFLSF